MRKVAALAAIAVGARLAFLAAAAKALGVPVLDLALRYDGHVYLRIARTFPHPYLDGGGPFLAGWFPGYPFLVRAAAFVFRDLRLSAVIVSLSFSALSVFLFHRLASRFSKRPDFATLLFVFFPPMWLVVGGLGFVEPMLICSAMLGVLAVLEERPRFLAVACVSAVLAQKSGFLVPVIASLLLGRKTLRIPWAAALSASVLAVLALQGYLWLSFGDPFINLKVQREVFGGSLFGVPFAAFVRGVLHPSAFGGVWRSAAIGASGLFYLAAAARAPRPLRPWLWTALAFFFSLGGDWAFHSLPRFLLVAAPPAILALEPLLAESLLLAPLVLLPYLLGLVEAAQAEALWRRAWGAGYAESASRELR